MNMQNTRPLLTIAIPTYNRKDCLELLLNALAEENKTIDVNDLEILISDNCSTDGTASFVSSYQVGRTNVKLCSNDLNKGADFNIAQCFDKANGEYVWIIGDDDLVIPGTISEILSMLRLLQPDITYLNAIGIDTDLATFTTARHKGQLLSNKVSKEAFARYVNIHLTFISGIIVKRSSYAKAEAHLYDHIGTSLIQLEWTINALVEGNEFVIVRTPILYARANRSGGYKLFEVFGPNYLSLVSTLCKGSQRIEKILRQYALIGHLPTLIYNYRFADVGDFGTQSVISPLFRSARRYPYFWLFLLPIASLPRPVAYLFAAASRLIYRSNRAFDKLFRTRSKCATSST